MAKITQDNEIDLNGSTRNPALIFRYSKNLISYILTAFKIYHAFPEFQGIVIIMLVLKGAET